MPRRQQRIIQACCIYCRKEFNLRGKQKWHDCNLAKDAKRSITNEQSKIWKKVNHYRQPDRCHGNIHLGKDTWKKCKRCGTLTPNRFGHCGNCLDTLSSMFDLDAITTFESGHTKISGHYIRPDNYKDNG